MRLSKTGLATAAVACLLSGYVFAAEHRGAELTSSVSDSVFARANTLADAGAGRIPANFVVDDFSQQAQTREPERMQMALATPALTQRLGSGQSNAANDAGFDATADQAPSAWLMVAVTLLLIGYQLRRKHRLLRPHRFHEL